ncbi:MAG: acyl carrier protein, partial [Acidobacteriota bacterium]
MATPIIEACQQRGLFELLDIHEFHERTWLIEQLGANEGYFSIALEVLESLAWIEANCDGALRRTIKADGYLETGLTSLYEVEPDWLIDHEAHARDLREKIEKVFFRPEVNGSAVSGLERGAIIVPLVVALQRVDGDLSRVDPSVSGTIRALFIRQDWVAVDETGLTASGRALLEHGAFNVAASYRPVLQAIPELLFGDHARAFRMIRDGRVSRAFFRRALSYGNVAAGLQGEIFDREPVEKPPRAIVDVPWDDGALLQEVFRTTIEQVGVIPESDVLLLRRFVDSLPEADAQEAVNEALRIVAADQPAHYVDRQGGPLDATTVLSCWQRHLQAVSETIVHSRLVLEVHAAPPRLMNERQEGCELEYVDWMDRLTHEYLIGAEAFITLAASVGLFNDVFVKRYPRSSDPCRISLHSLTKRDYIVRHARPTDLERLCRLEKLCWQHTQTPRKQIRSRLLKYPEGQFVLEKDGTVLGVIYSQRIARTDALMTCTAADVHELHDTSGSIVQLLAVNIDPRAQNSSYGDQLLAFMLQRCSLMTGVEQVVGVSLCKSYDGANVLSFEEYIRLQGGSQDVVLAFHQAHGAEIVKAIPGYRPEDHANLNNGVLVAYDILNLSQRVATTAEPPTKRIGRQEVGRFVAGEAARLLGIDQSELDTDRPVMEMGLDSADLLKLQRFCEGHFGLRLQAGFFFEENGQIRSDAT